jgi:hypothetical protein
MTDLRCKCDTSVNPKANPLDPICNKTPGMSSTLNLSGEARPGAPMAAMEDLHAGGTVGYEKGPGKGAKGNHDGTSGGAGGAPSASGQLQALNRDSQPSATGKDLNTNIITGQTGSNGIGAFGSGGGGGGSSGGGSSRFAGSSANDRFNLSKFLPKTVKNFYNRGVAGMSVPAIDGLTGPSGPSIWEKSTNAFQNQDRKGMWIRGPLLQPTQIGPARVPASAKRY